MTPKEEAISRARAFTGLMKTLQNEIGNMGQQRRALLSELYSQGVPQTELAEALGISRQQVYMEIRKHKEKPF